ncbi:MAG: amidophosphoribosyltransferase [Bacteroidetes bacterium]|nr:MAG: amidophosphoribosyltransferase [Bacteroidota bacterium]TAG89068.1 MAG: amidophosphoribosyltransferase [Bacteroidota bacterium]
MCGIALVRLRKPFGYYVEKYKNYEYGLQKLYFLMKKLQNRGQDGAGIANIKIDIPAGKRYISRYRSNAEKPIEDVFNRVHAKIEQEISPTDFSFECATRLKEDVAFLGEIYLGHLRYGTHGSNTLENCHPFLRQSNWRSRNLVCAGNFNLTNVDELFSKLVELGQHPKDKMDTVLVMEKIGHFLDEENFKFIEKYKDTLSREEITQIIENELDIRKVLERSCKDFDGGYALAGVTGYGASFVARDPNGIRPAYYYADDEIIVVASEKPAIKAVFNVDYKEIKEISPAHALIIDKNGNYSQQQFTTPKEQKSCSFERVYFSRGNDPEIYQERKDLGRFLVPQILKAIDYDLENTIFSYIPNTSETAFLGMTKGLDKYLIDTRKSAIFNQNLSDEELEKILSFRPRIEKLALKDVKLRTFITDDSHRDEMVAGVYDTTYEIVRKGIDNVVLIDDSIVRGTTLEKSILKMLDTLDAKKIVIVSSSPQIRFPDCYGIDMSKMGDFIAFRAVKALWEEKGEASKLEDVFEKCLESLNSHQPSPINYVKELYASFSDEDISKKIAEIVSKEINTKVEIIFQTVENLHLSCPKHTGDWYFTGNYPTIGGNRVVHQAYVNFMLGVKTRAY